MDHSHLSGDEEEALRKLFLGGLDREKTLEPQLQEYFGVYGQVVDCVVIKDNNTKASKGFGFVTMATVDETDNVLLDKVHPETHIINGKSVEVKRAVPRGRDILVDAVTKLFIAGFKDAKLTEEQLRNYFGGKCDVLKVHLVTDKETGRSKGYGFVELSNRHMVDKAAIIENHKIDGITVVAKKALPKGEDGSRGGGRGGARGRGRGRGGGGYGGGSYGGGGYGGGDSYGYSNGSDSYGYGDRSYGGGRGGRGGGRGGRGGGGYGSSSYGGASGGGNWSNDSYDAGWGSGSGSYDAGTNYAGSSSNYGPMKGGYGGSSYDSGSYGGGSYGSGGGGGYGSGRGRPY